MAGTYLGVAQAALDLTLQHMKTRQFTHSGQSLADFELLQHRVGQLWISVEKSRLLRDARASHVMSPTTDMLTLWTGRSALGLSLF